MAGRVAQTAVPPGSDSISRVPASRSTRCRMAVRPNPGSAPAPLGPLPGTNPLPLFFRRCVLTVVSVPGSSYAHIARLANIRSDRG